MKMRAAFVCALLLLVVVCGGVDGHGMMLDPPNRSSIWRYDGISPQNYDDNSNFCGGFAVQYYTNGGNCGVCGDNYADPQPRANENGGTYGRGQIAGTYEAGSEIDVGIQLTANHLGTFTYSLCVLSDPTTYESEDCFEALELADGSSGYSVSADEFNIVNKVKLPEGLTCDRCVLRWHYKTGNSWGVCEDGTGAMGCGDQETFRSCSDITIV